MVHVFPSFGHGGVPIRIAGVINHFADRYRHTILSLDGATGAVSRIDPSLDVNVHDPGIDKRRPLASLFRIRRVLVDLAPDLLLTYNWGSIEWALANRIFPVSLHIHLESGFGPDEVEGQIPRRVKFRRLALRHIRALVVPSFTLVAIAREIWRIDPAKIRHIPNGVDCDLFGGPGDAASVPGFERRPGELIVGTLAPLRAEKNLHRLLRVFAKVEPARPVRLLIAGDGVERAGLEVEAERLGIADRVIFTGHVEQPEKIYPLMDVFAITSDTEQMPNTLIQAMAASLPVAGVDAGDIKANLSPQNREMVVDREDEKGLADFLVRVLNDDEFRSGLAAANRAHVAQNYGAETMFAAYGSLFDEFLNSSSRS
jgi:L-malate glycosyltransferase